LSDATTEPDKHEEIEIPWEMIEAGAKAILELDASGVMGRSEAEMLSEEVLKRALAVSHKNVRIDDAAELFERSATQIDPAFNAELALPR
jgi:hypothetical protein